VTSDRVSHRKMKMSLRAGLINDRKRYWLVQGALLLLLAINGFTFGWSWFEFSFGAVLLLICLYWLIVTKMPSPLTVAYAVTILPMLFFDEGLKIALDTISGGSKSEGWLSAIAILYMLLVFYGWLITAISFFRKRPQS